MSSCVQYGQNSLEVNHDQILLNIEPIDSAYRVELNVPLPTEVSSIGTPSKEIMDHHKARRSPVSSDCLLETLIPQR